MKLATLGYIRKNGQTLMMHRIRPRQVVNEKWNGLGGKMNDGETPEECLIREIEEECGLIIENFELKGFLSFPRGTGEGESWQVFVFVIREFSGELQTPESAEDSLEWVDDDKLMDLPLMVGDRIFMPLLDESGFFTGKFVYIDGKLVEHEIKQYK